jgi:ribA/ribD-fused uncharacterized protein
MMVMVGNKKYKFFWGGYLSNWYKSDFTINDVTFNCGEQYMMYQKAILFNDQQMSEQILKVKDPKEQKKLGRKVKGFRPDIWDNFKYQLVKEGLFEKFKQNQNLYDYLKSYYGFILIEASPYDRIWGIGYNEADAMNNIDTWGENLLGKILTEICSEICK